VLPILILPREEFECEALLPRLRGRPRLPRRFAARPKQAEARRARWRARLALDPEVVIETAAPEDNDAGGGAGEASLADCERLLHGVLRRARRALGRTIGAEVLRASRAPMAARLSGRVLSSEAAAWLLWAMSWRGVSTVRELFAPALHPPTLLVKWWISMPADWRFGPAGPLLRALASALHATYAFWQTLCGRMRARGAYFLDARLVAIEFRSVGARERAKNADD
jgi:hypothetical protein